MSIQATTPTLYLVSPDSLTSWFSHFTDLGPADEVLNLGEQPFLDVNRVTNVLRRNPHLERVVIYSSHDTLARDRHLADSLELLGHPAQSQSHACVALGGDKLLMKRFLRHHGIPTPDWMSADEPFGLGDQAFGPVVVKRRGGTQSVGTRMAHLPALRLAENEYGERYQAGIEYSVIAYRDRHRVVTLPPVWKGPTSPSLVPPWRRLRLCPYPELPAELDARLRTTAAAVATVGDANGYIEVEFLSSGTDVTVLEINPRICGTMRVAAMAAGLRIFSLHQRTDLTGDLPAVRWAAEAPYHGEHLCLPREDVFATSRLTVASDDPAELPDKLAEFGAPAQWADGLWPQPAAIAG
jgi:hypothetical protein